MVNIGGCKKSAWTGQRKALVGNCFCLSDLVAGVSLTACPSDRLPALYHPPCSRASRMTSSATCRASFLSAETS